MPYVSSIERFAEKRGVAIGEKKGEKRGEQRGEQRGDKKARQDNAKQMLMDGLPIDKIARYSGLSEEEIKKLVN